MATAQKLSCIKNITKHSIITSKSLQPVLPLSYLSKCDAELFKPEIKGSIHTKSNDYDTDEIISNTSGCNCRCIWCGWNQSQPI